MSLLSTLWGVPLSAFDLRSSACDQSGCAWGDAAAYCQDRIALPAAVAPIAGVELPQPHAAEDTDGARFRDGVLQDPIA